MYAIRSYYEKRSIPSSESSGSSTSSSSDDNEEPPPPATGRGKAAKSVPAKPDHSKVEKVKLASKPLTPVGRAAKKAAEDLRNEMFAAPCTTSKSQERHRFRKAVKAEADKGRCYKCFCLGHWAPQCAMPGVGPGTSKSTNSRICEACGSFNHPTQDCVFAGTKCLTS